MKELIRVLILLYKTGLGTGAAPASGTAAKQRGKLIAKGVGLAFAGIYLAGFMGYFIWLVVSSMYQTLAPVHLESLVLVLLWVVNTLFTLVTTLLYALGAYSSSRSEEFLLSLPLQSRTIFGAKFFQVYGIQLINGLVVLGLGSIIYGIHSGSLGNPVFWLGTLLAVLLSPALPVCLIFLILVPVFNLGKGRINKRVIQSISMVISLFLAVGLNLALQTGMRQFQDPAFLLQAYASGSLDFIQSLTAGLPPAGWYTLGLSAAPAPALGAMGLLLGSSLALVGLIILGLAPAYRHSIIGLNDEKTRTMDTQATHRFLARTTRQRSAFRTLLFRDIQMVLHEPAYLFNGPFIIFLLPVIMAISLGVAMPKNALEALPALLQSLSPGNTAGTDQDLVLFGICGVLSLSTLFLGTSTSLSATAFSREGKGLGILKALPLPFRALAGAKLAHALLYQVLALVIILVPSLVLLALPPLGFAAPTLGLLALVCSGLSLGLGGLIHLADLALDTARPKLNWDSPVAAFKQNANSVISVFLSLGVTGGLAVLAILVMEKNLLTLGLIALAALALAGLGWRLYLPWAQRSFQSRDL